MEVFRAVAAGYQKDVLFAVFLKVLALSRPSLEPYWSFVCWNSFPCVASQRFY
jgi:hypothetical protein